MTLKLAVELSDGDLEHFRRVLGDVRARTKDRGEGELVVAARELLAQVAGKALPNFVRERLERLRELIAMLEDADFGLDGADRERVVTALAYVVEPHDLIPDDIPGLGFLDDAVMLELIVVGLRHELEAYRDFCRYRSDEGWRRGTKFQPTRDEWLAAKRRQLFLRMRRRREERRARHAGSAPGLW